MKNYDYLWFKTYDNEFFMSYFCDVNYHDYILLVVTDPNYQYFVTHANDRKKYWDSSSHQYFDILELVSNYYQLDTLDDKIMYIEEPYAKKLAVKFRFWLDTYRLYCLLFFGLDTVDFQEDRVVSSIARFNRALASLFATYHTSMFYPVQFEKFIQSLRVQVAALQRVINQRKELLILLTKELMELIMKIARGDKIQPRDIESELFRRISKEINYYNTEKVKIVEYKLLSTTTNAEGIKIDQYYKLWVDQFTKGLIKNAQKIYDPYYLEQLYRYRIEKERKKLTRKSTLYKVNMQMTTMNKGDRRERMSNRTRFNIHKILNKSSNYPYNFKNILYNDFHADLVQVKLEAGKGDATSDSSDLEGDLKFAFYYDEFLDKLREADRNHARVTVYDLVEFNADEKLTKQVNSKAAATDMRWIDRDVGINKGNDKNSSRTNYQIEDISDDEGSFEYDYETTKKRKKLRLNNYYGEMKTAEEEKELRRIRHSWMRFNVYQQKHPRDSKGWGLIRSLYNYLKVKKKLNTFLYEKTRYYYYIDRFNLRHKPREVV